jgi:hypothetical protein
MDNFFFAVNITTITRKMNEQADPLEVSTSIFRPPNISDLKYTMEILYRSSIPNNVKHWQVFEDDQQILLFLQMKF